MGLWDQLLSADSAPRWAWVWTGEGYERETYAAIFDTARCVAASLKRHGAADGSVVAAIITNSLPSVCGFLGAWCAGAKVASLPIIARGQSIGDYVELLGRLCSDLGASCVVTEGRFAKVLSDAGLGRSTPLFSYEGLSECTDRASIEPPPEDEVMFVQFSSGTTAEPRGVRLTGRAIDAQLRLLADRLAIEPARDVGLMWLPLSHDMGFFGGNLLAWYTGMRGVLSSPERFLTEPRSWFEDCARFGATVTVAPSFAYPLAVRSLRLQGPLSLRLCLTGGDLVSLSHLASCAAALEGYGLSLRRFTVAYGLAEATLAVTVGDLDEEPRRVWVDSRAFIEDDLSLCDPNDPNAREVISCGSPLPGFDVRCEGPVGELVVRGPSLAKGYWGGPRSTEDRFAAGGFSTGDVGFVRHGELFVVGRADDRMIVGGRNVDVGDLEEEIAEDRLVRGRNCVLVDVRDDGAQRIVLVTEAVPGADGSELLRRAREAAARRHGLRIDDVVLVGRGQFPKTPSGKAQRYRCREIAAIGTRKPT